jgi:hypothetical protein
MLSLKLHIQKIDLQGLKLQTSSGWQRQTTTVILSGLGHKGFGEDVTYASDEQVAFQQAGPPTGLCGNFTLASFSAALDALSAQQWFSTEPAQEAAWHYRRWAFESAALDLALRQAGLSLADWVQSSALSTNFVHSVGLGEPPSVEILRARITQVPGLRFKLDYQASWDHELVNQLHDLNAVDVVDFKGHYHGSFSGPAPDADAYAMVAECLPNAILEDPAWTPECAAALAPYHDRLSWDAPLHFLRDLDALPIQPKHLNIKPSRFSTVERLLRVLNWLKEHKVAAYGGGQFELGPGRLQIQHLASVCYPHAANDIAPVEYHADAWSTPPPASPLPAFEQTIGFGGWTG